MSLILSAGGWAELLATGFSVLAILGAAVVYWVLMSNFLYSTVQYIHDKIVGTNDTDTGEAPEFKLFLVYAKPACEKFPGSE